MLYYNDKKWLSFLFTQNFFTSAKISGLIVWQAYCLINVYEFVILLSLMLKMSKPDDRKTYMLVVEFEGETDIFQLSYDTTWENFTVLVGSM